MNVVIEDADESSCSSRSSCHSNSEESSVILSSAGEDKDSV